MQNIARISFSFIACILLLLGHSATIYAQTQDINLNPATSSQKLGTEFSLSAWYGTTPEAKTLTGVGVDFFFDSTKLVFEGFENVLQKSLFATEATPQDDVANKDGDAGTDKFVKLSWTDFGGAWPGADAAFPLKLADLKFSVLPGAALGDTPVNLVSSGTASGYTANFTGSTVSLVAHGPAAKFVILDPADTNVDAGAVATVQLQDADGVLATGAPDTQVTVNVDKGTITQAQPITLSNGVATVNVNYDKVGTVNISLEDTEGTGLDVSSTQDVAFIFGAADKIKLGATKDQVVTNGQDSTTVSGAIVDQYGNTVTDYDAADVGFAITEGQNLGTFPGGAAAYTVTVANIQNGVAEAVLTSENVDADGDIKVTASSGALTPYDPATPANDFITVQAINKILDGITISTVDGGMVNTTTPKVGETVQFQAVGHYKLPGQDVDPALDADITNVVGWDSSDPAKGVITPAGLFTAVGAGATDVTAGLGAVTSNAVAMDVQSAEEVVFDATALPTTMAAGDNVDFGAAVSGGTGQGFNFAFDSQPAGNAGLLTAAGVFSVDETLPFAGEYVINATDPLSGASASHSIKVPMKVDPESKVWLETDGVQGITVLGAPAGSTYTATIQDTAGVDVTGVAGYGTISGGAGGVFVYTPCDVDEIMSFNFGFEVDAQALIDAGLEMVVSGPYRVLPVRTYAGYIVDEGNVGIGGATVAVTAPAQWAQMTLTSDLGNMDDGHFEFALPYTGAVYEFGAKKDGFVSRAFNSKGWDFVTPANNTFTLNAVAAGAYLTGTVNAAGVGYTPVVNIRVFYDDAGTNKLAGETKAPLGDSFYLGLAEDPGAAQYTVAASTSGYYTETTVGMLPATGLDLILAATGDMNAVAGGDSPPTVLAGQNVSMVSIPFGAVDTKGGTVTSVSAAVTSTTNPVLDRPLWTRGAGRSIYDIKVTDQAGGDAAFVDFIFVTVPFDLSEVGPGDFEAGRYVVYKAPTRADLLAGTNVEVYSWANGGIVSIDYVGDGETGLVTIKTKELSALAVGAVAPAAAAPAPAVDDSSTCFVSTAQSGFAAAWIFMVIAAVTALGAAALRRK